MNSYVCKGEFTLGEYVKPDLHFLAVEKVLSIGHFKASCQDEESFDEGPYATHSTGDYHDGDLEDADGGIAHHETVDAERNDEGNEGADDLGLGHGAEGDPALFAGGYG